MYFKLSRSGLLAHSISAITLLNAGGAYGAAVIEEIIVMAQKRPEAIQDVPLAVTAFSGEFVRDRQLDDVKDLVLYSPGVTGDSKDSFIDTLSIRGIVTNDFGVGGDPSIGVFKNNLYQGRNGAVVTSLYDLERAEVLRGPQGFLFGRNSIAGAISVFTVRPDFDNHDGYLELDVAERHHVIAEGAVNIPVNDTLAFRLAGYHAEEDGYSENKYNVSQNDLIAPDKNAGRVSARYQNDKTEVNLMLEYEQRDQSGSMYRATEKGPTWEQLQVLFGPFEMGGTDIDVNSNMGLGERDNGKIFSSGLQVDVDLGFATFNSQTGYRHHDYKYAEDFDATQLGINDYAQSQNGEYLEQELRLVSQSDGPLSWYTGVSLYHEEINVLFSQKGDEEVMCMYYAGESCTDYIGPGFTPYPQGLLERNSVKGNYKGWAAYADLTYAINDRLDASLGVRYTYDQKRFKLYVLPVGSQLGPFFAMGYTTDGYLVDAENWSEVTPRALLEYHPNDDWMLFGSITRGYKSGGFGSFAIDPDVLFGTLDVTSAEANPDSFDPESVWSYEVGAKGDLLDGTMRVGINTYYYDYEDLQVNVPGVGGGIVVDNVGQVDGWGVEGTVEYAITDNLDVLLNAAYADSKVEGAAPICDDTNLCDGEPLPQVPQYSGSAVVNLHFPARDGEISFTYEMYTQSKTHGGLLQLSEAVNDTYIDMAVRGGYESDQGWAVIAYVENLTDEVHFDGVAEGSDILPAHYFGPSRPRTVGVRMTWDF